MFYLSVETAESCLKKCLRHKGVTNAELITVLKVFYMAFFTWQTPYISLPIQSLDYGTLTFSIYFT